MIYLASVYSIHAKTNGHHDTWIRERRYQFALEKTAQFLKKGYKVFSPIVHCHEMSKTFDMPKDYKFWQEYDRSMLDRCDEIWVLKMPHWRDSEGISDEIQYSIGRDIPVSYIDCKEFQEVIKGITYFGFDYI